MINIRRTKSTVPVENDLNEKSIRFEFIKKTKRTAIKINPVLDMTIGFKKIKYGCSKINGIAPKNIAIAGVGNPIKWDFPDPVTLNLANLKAEPSGNINPMNTQGINSTMELIGQPIKNSNGWFPANTNNWAKIIPGAKPEVTISAIESNWTPKSLSTLNNLAKRPSQMSKNTPAKRKIKAVSNWNI